MTPNLPPSSAASANFLPLPLKPSRWLLRGVVVMHALAGVCVLASAIPWWLMLVLVSLVVWSGWAQFRRLKRVYTLCLYAGGRVVIEHPARLELALLAGGIATRWLVILYLEAESGRLAVPIARDAVEAEAFRRLRVGLRTRLWLPESKN